MYLLNILIQLDHHKAVFMIYHKQNHRTGMSIIYEQWEDMTYMLTTHNIPVYNIDNNFITVIHETKERNKRIYKA
jgi:hypothetical protein